MYRPEHCLSLEAENFELRGVEVGMTDGKSLVVERLYVRSIKLHGVIMPVPSEDRRTITIYRIVDSAQPDVVIGTGEAQ